MITSLWGHAGLLPIATKIFSLTRSVFLAVLATFNFTATSVASPVYNYEIVLTVLGVSAPCSSLYSFPEIGFGCGVVPGTKWTGTFQIATDLSNVPDGPYDIPFVSMHLQTGDMVWDHGLMMGGASDCAANGTSNCLSGYRNIVGPDYYANTGTGLNVKNGSVVGFAGGFYSGGDSHFIDFDYLFGAGAKVFGASALEVYVGGTYEIRSLPEPSTLLLFGIALLALLFGNAYRARRHASR